MKKKLLPIAIIVVLAVSLGLLLYAVAREQIREALAKAYGAVHAAVTAIPQAFYWGLLVMIIILSALRSILGEVDRPPPAARLAAGGRAAEWREWLTRAAHPSSSRSFYNWQVARNLARLADEVLAQQMGVAPGEAERQIEDGDVPMPAEVRSYFVSSLRSRPAHSARWWTRLSGQLPADPLDLDPVQAVDYIESQMEVPHDDHSP